MRSAKWFWLVPWFLFSQYAFAGDPTQLFQTRFSRALTAGTYPLHIDLYFAEPRQIAHVAAAFTVDLPGVDNDELRRAEVEGGGQRLRLLLGNYSFVAAPEQVWLDLDIELANGKRVTPERLTFKNAPIDLAYAQPTLRLDQNGLTVRLLLQANTIGGGSVGIAAAAPTTEANSANFFSRREPLWLEQGRFEWTFARSDLPAQIPIGSRWLVVADIDDIWGQRYSVKQTYSNDEIDSLVSQYLEIEPASMTFSLKGESIRIKRFSRYYIAGRVPYSGDHEGFEYASDNSDIVYIDRFGRAVAVSPGNTVLTVKQPGNVVRIPVKVLY